MEIPDSLYGYTCFVRSWSGDGDNLGTQVVTGLNRDGALFIRRLVQLLKTIANEYLYENNNAYKLGGISIQLTLEFAEVDFTGEKIEEFVQIVKEREDNFAELIFEWVRETILGRDEEHGPNFIRYPESIKTFNFDKPAFTALDLLA
jgi:hypothetical protein